MSMSGFSKIQMSCFAGDAMLDASGETAGAQHASSRTGDTEHARTRQTEDDPGDRRDGTEARAGCRAFGLSEPAAIEESAHLPGSTPGASVPPKMPLEYQPGTSAGCRPAVQPYARRGCWSGSRDGRERTAAPPL